MAGRPSLGNGVPCIERLRDQNARVFMFMGKRVLEPVDHQVIRPSINAMRRDEKEGLAGPLVGVKA